MRILICINHPAHVHYFRNLIKIMESEGHEFRVMNRDSDVINKLLDFYGIDHITGEKRRKRKGVIASFLSLSKAVLACLKVSRTFNPDLYLGFASAPCAITSWICRKPSVLLDDTEFNKMNHMVYMPFCSTVLTPFYFQKHLDEGKKQLYFNAFIEQLFLHSKYK